MILTKIRERVDKLVRYFGTRDPFEIIREMNVILVPCPLDGVRGFYQYFKRNHIIYIDENLPKHERTFVCAHELGHLFLHKSSNAIFMDTSTQFNTNKYELEANRFAMELLLPDSILIECKNCTIEQISSMTGYRQKLLELRLRQQPQNQ